MKEFLKFGTPLSAALAIAACSAGGFRTTPTLDGAALGSSLAVAAAHIPEWQAEHLASPDCAQVVGKPTCLALSVNGVSLGCFPSSGGCGWTPAQLESAYNLTSDLGKGSGQIVAVVEAGDDASAGSELANYRKTFKLGKATFKKYNQNGQKGHYPPSCDEYSWCGETALDIEMISAACPMCTIYLMEATDTTIAGFEEAEASAVKLGAHIVSNSWTCRGSTDCGDSNFSQYFDSPGVAYVASSGDSGYGNIGAPSVLASVIAVGGTQLSISGSTYAETIWDDAGAGCATGITKPSWQHDPDCTYRTDADVSAEAGCSPGVAVFGGVYGTGEWREVCGTSVSAPFAAGVIGLAGNASSQNGGENFWTLKKKKLKDLHYVSSGNDGSCGGEYLCQAGTKQFGTYSGPAGWGTPNGIGAF